MAQPLFDLLGNNATFFVAHRASPAAIVVFALVVFLVPAAVCSSVVAVAWAVDEAAGRITLAVVVGLLGAVAILQFVPSIRDSIVASVAALLVVAAVVGVGFGRSDGVRSFVRTVGWLSPVVPAVFLFASGASDIIFASEVRPVGSGGNDHDVVFVVFDELGLSVMLDENLDIDEGRFANFARLAEMSTWYDNTISVSSTTKNAVPAMLSGSIPDRDSLPLGAEFPQNLFTSVWLSHTVVADEIVTQLCPENICAQDRDEIDDRALYDDAGIAYLHRILPTDAAEEWLPRIDDRWAGFGEEPDETGSEPTREELEKAAIERQTRDLGRDHEARWMSFLDRLEQRGGPTLSYHHSGLPHSPYSYLADGDRYVSDGWTDGLGMVSWMEAPGAVDNSIRRYSQQARLIDRWLGMLLDELEGSGRFDNTLLVVVADHGVAHVPGLPRREVHEETISSMVSVPLFIKYPDQETGARDSRQAQTIDIFATFADVLSVRLEEPIEGRSLLDDWESADRTVINWPQDADLEAALDLEGAVAIIDEAVPVGEGPQGGFAGLDGVDYGGRSIASFEKAPPVDGTVRPERLAPLQIDPLDRDPLPVLLRGPVDDVPVGTDVLVALNGTVAGAATVDLVEGERWLAALLDPAAAREGRNLVEVFVFDGDSLAPLTVGE